MRHTTERWVVGLTAAAMMFGVSGCGLIDKLEERLSELAGEPMQDATDEAVAMAQQEVDEALVEAFQDERTPMMAATSWLQMMDQSGTVIVDRTATINGGQVAVAGTASKNEERTFGYEVAVTIDHVELEYKGVTFVLSAMIDISGETSCVEEGVNGHFDMTGYILINSFRGDLDLSGFFDAAEAHFEGIANGDPYQRLRTDLEWKVCNALAQN